MSIIGRNARRKPRALPRRTADDVLSPVQSITVSRCFFDVIAESIVIVFDRIVDNIALNPSHWKIIDTDGVEHGVAGQRGPDAIGVIAFQTGGDYSNVRGVKYVGPLPCPIRSGAINWPGEVGVDNAGDLTP